MEWVKKYAFCNCVNQNFTCTCAKIHGYGYYSSSSIFSVYLMVKGIKGRTKMQQQWVFSIQCYDEFSTIIKSKSGAVVGLLYKSESFHSHIFREDSWVLAYINYQV